ncbi:unnamed protein product [Caenorhabditis brenneri]
MQFQNIPKNIVVERKRKVDSDDDPDPNQPSTSDYRPPASKRGKDDEGSLESSPSQPSTSDSRRPGNQRSISVITLNSDSSDEGSDPNEPSTSEPTLKSILKHKTPEKADQQPKNVAFPTISREESSSTDEDSDEDTPEIREFASLQFLGKGEENVIIASISLTTIEKFFGKFEGEFVQFNPEEDVVVPRDLKLLFFKASEKWKRCVITANRTVHFNDFTSDVYSEVDNGKMVAVDVTNGRRRFKIIIEKSGITYEVAKRSQKGL